MNGFGQYLSSLDGDHKPQSTYLRTAAGGLITAMVDPVDNVTCYQYDNFGNVITQINFPDRTKPSEYIKQTFEYDTTKANAITKIVDGIGRTTVRELNDAGDVLKETVTSSIAAPEGNPNSTFTKYTYYASGAAKGLIETMEDALGHVTTYHYDNYGRLESRVYADGNSDQYAYGDLTGNVTRTIDPDGFVMEYTYDALNRVKSNSVDVAIDGVTYVELFDYDAAGNEIRHVDRNEVPSTTKFDSRNRPIEVVAASESLKATSKFAYEYGAMTTPYSVINNSKYEYFYTQDARGFVSVRVFDQYQNLRYIYDTLGRKTENIYNDANQLITTVMPTGASIVHKLDGLGREIERSGPTVEKTLFTYDEANRIKTETQVNTITGNQTIRYEYNIFNAAAKVTDAENIVTRYYFDAVGNNKKIIEADGSSQSRTTEFEYDNRNRSILKTVAGTAVTKTSYYPSGLIHESTLPGTDQPKTTFTYDALGRTVTVEDALGFKTHNIYDGLGNLTAIVDARGSGRSDSLYRQVMTYNDLNQMISSTDQLGNTTRFEYDLNGNQKKLIDPRASVNGVSHPETRYDYDAANRPILVTNAAGRTTTYTYNLLDQVEVTRAQRLTASGSIVTDQTTTKHDNSGRLQFAIDANGHRTDYTYDSSGNLIKVVDARGDAYRTEYKYDRKNRVIRSIVGAGATTPAVTKTEYHPLGMISKVTDPLEQATTYTFNALGYIEQSVEAAGLRWPRLPRPSMTCAET